jgi:hypothetical protein
VRKPALSEWDGLPSGVYVPQAQVESEVLNGLRDVLNLCADPRKFTRAVNRQLRQIWEASTDAGERIAAIDRKVENILRAVGGRAERRELGEHPPTGTTYREGGRWSRPPEKQGGPPELDVATAWTTDVRRTNCFGRVARVSASNSCALWLGK